MPGLKRMAYEKWYLHKLETSDDDDRRWAVLRLAEMGSRRAARPFLEVLAAAVEAPGDGIPLQFETMAPTPLPKAPGFSITEIDVTYFRDGSLEFPKGFIALEALLDDGSSWNKPRIRCESGEYSLPVRLKQALRLNEIIRNFKWFDDPKDVAGGVRGRFSMLGPGGFSETRAVLRDPSHRPLLRALAALALANAWPDSPRARKAISEATRNPCPQVQKTAIFALARLDELARVNGKDAALAPKRVSRQPE